MKKLLIIIGVFLALSLTLEAKSFKFKIDSPLSDISSARSTTPGTKMVKVIAYGGTSDKAIDRAMLDAIVAATFYGIRGNEFIENTPPVLVNGLDQYNKNKKFFDTFFKKGGFLSFVSNVNSNYPTGTNNVSTSKGKKVTIYLIIEWKKLDDYLKLQNLTTQSSLLNL